MKEIKKDINECDSWSGIIEYDDKEGIKPASAQTLYSWMKEDINPIFSEIENKDIEAFAHSLRHSRAEILSQGLDTRLKNKDGTNRKYSLEEIQILLNHNSSATTEIYVVRGEDDSLDDLF